MLQRFCQNINEKQLFDTSEKILLTVSGGIDSVVMADLFHKAGYCFGIAHCNFGLRGSESDGDEEFVRGLADKYKTPFYVQHFQTKEYADDNGISIQMAARELRYSWFNELIHQHSFQFIATAHHRNDALESVLLNITKGTGIQGLTGIRVKTENVIRPLLSFSREDIEAYAKEHNLSWREDSSNSSSKYQRNKIRLEVIPLLKQINPSLDNTFEHTLERITAAENLFQFQIERIKDKALVQSGRNISIDNKVLLEYPQAEFILYELTREYGFSFHDIKNLYHSSQVGKYIQNPENQFKLIKERESFLLIPASEEEERYWIDKNLNELKTSSQNFSFRIIENQNFTIPKENTIACLDFEKLQFPLELRTWKNGDWFIPLGFGKRKKISDFLVDKKIDSGLKSKVKLLLSGDLVVWVTGMRMDDRFKIKPETKKILIVTIE